MSYKLLIWSTKYVWKERKSLIISSLFCSIILGIAPYFSLMITKNFLNEVSNFIKTSSNSSLYYNIIILLAAQFILQITVTGISYCEQYFEKKNLLILEHTLVIEMVNKLSKIPLLLFDDPEFHNHLSRINSNISERFWSPIRNMKDLIRILISVGSYAFILWSINWELMIICALVTVPLFYIYSVLGKNKFKLSVENSPLVKEMSYLYSILNDRNHAKEIRAYSLYFYFTNKWSEKYKEQTNKIISLEKKQYFIKIGTESINSIFYIFISVFILFLIKKAVSVQIGDFVVVNQALINTQGALNRLSMCYSDIKINLLYLKDLHNFLELEEKSQEENINFPSGNSSSFLNLHNVTFKYPNQTHPAIVDINISIEKGEKIAIIGNNGSGKTTLIKCLVGLFSEYQGEIEISGENIKNIKDEELREKFAIIFQDFLKYPYSIKDNISFGNVNNDLDNLDAIVLASEKTGIHDTVMELPEKYNTYLGNFIKPGIDFSGGQWQKLALSRAIYRNSDILVLDEPTASLDSQSEIQIFKELLSTAHEKTVIFISHRISSAKYADKIIMMNQGRITEQGSHDQLIAEGGEYYKIYSTKIENRTTVSS
ncbi:ABC transporter ATP-binding protein [Paenibacillus sp. FSL H7-0690]|uniref:ABC transporter ATP-binding protein n=1 Tax=Paenibacillus sp. FSL H7-0690 TaxID=2921437 RepID=UPI0030ED6788